MVTAPAGFEPVSQDPNSCMIDHYTTGLKCHGQGSNLRLLVPSEQALPLAHRNDICLIHFLYAAPNGPGANSTAYSDPGAPFPFFGTWGCNRHDLNVRNPDATRLPLSGAEINHYSTVALISCGGHLGSVKNESRSMNFDDRNWP